MKVTCLKCYKEIEPTNINVAADVAYCPACNETFRLSNLIGPPSSVSRTAVEAEEVPRNFDLHDPPEGVSIHEEYPKTVIKATTRSAAAFFLVPFTLVWSGGSIGGTTFAAIAMESIFPILFAIPFVAVSIFLWSLCLMMIGGKVEVVFDGDRGEIFTGIGFLGIRKKFQWDEMDSVEQKVSISYSRRGSSNVNTHIVLRGKRLIKFASGLSEERRYYLFNAIKVLQPSLGQF